VVVHLWVPEKSLRARLVHRAAVEDRADDADPEVIDRRMRVYQDETEPLVAHYRRLGVLVTVDGDAGPDEVARRIVAGVRAAHG
jgi:adenylate kinase